MKSSNLLQLNPLAAFLKILGIIKKNFPSILPIFPLEEDFSFIYCITKYDFQTQTGFRYFSEYIHSFITYFVMKTFRILRFSKLYMHI